MSYFSLLRSIILINVLLAHTQSVSNLVFLYKIGELCEIKRRLKDLSSLCHGVVIGVVMFESTDSKFPMMNRSCARGRGGDECIDSKSTKCCQVLIQFEDRMEPGLGCELYWVRFKTILLFMFQTSVHRTNKSNIYVAS